jgi:cardiolipin synthase
VWPALTPSHWLSLHGLFTGSALFVYVVASHVLQQRRHPSAAIGWVLSMLLLPYAALPLYLLFGTRKLTRGGSSSLAARAARPIDDKGAWPDQVAAALGYGPPVCGVAARSVARPL